MELVRLRSGYGETSSDETNLKIKCEVKMKTNLLKKLVMLSLAVAVTAPLCAMEDGGAGAAEAAVADAAGAAGVVADDAAVAATLQSMPDAVLAQMTQFLGGPALALLAQTNQQFYQLCNDPYVLRHALTQEEKNRALFNAVRDGVVKRVHLFLKAGADVDALDQDGWTPLHRAADRGYAGVVVALLAALGNDRAQRAVVNAHDRWGVAPLHRAALNGHTEVVAALLEHGAAANVQDPNGRTPLHLAALNGHAEVVAVLLEHCADVNIQDRDVKTPLYWAAVDGNVAVVTALLAAGADVNAVDPLGRTPLQIAEQNKHDEVVEILRQHAGGAGAAADGPILRSGGQAPPSLR